MRFIKVNEMNEVNVNIKQNSLSAVTPVTLTHVLGLLLHRNTKECRGTNEYIQSQKRGSRIGGRMSPSFFDLFHLCLTVSSGSIVKKMLFISNS